MQSLLFLGIVFTLLSPSVQGSVLATSQLETCTQKTGQANLECAEKLVLLLSVESRLLEGTEILHLDLSEVTDSESGVVKKFESPLLVDIKKSQPRYVYPLVYERDFAYYAYESVISTGKFGCEDDFSGASEPTCGWQIDPFGSGKRIEHSQGFCCECDFLNFEGVDATRGSTCELLNMGAGASSAHCLRFSDISTWYKAFTMLAPKLVYTIDLFFSLKIQNTDGETSSYIDEKLSLGDAKRSDKTKYAYVELVGDLATFQDAPQLANKILLVPKYEKKDLYGLHDRTHQLLVDREAITFDGTECNKIGTSFVAFQTQQATACQSPKGSCLANQIKDLRERDYEKLRQKQTTSYFVHSQGLEYQDLVGDGSLQLSYPVQEVQTTLIRLELKADSVSFVKTVADGALSELTLHDLGPVNVLQASVTNLDPVLTASFTLEIDRCANATSAIFQPQTVRFSAKASEMVNQNFTVRMADASENSFSCMVTLYNAELDKLDELPFMATIKEVKSVQHIPDGAKPIGQSEAGWISLTGGGACPACNGYAELFCMAWNQCWRSLAESILVLGVILLTFYLTVFKCLPCRLVKCCFNSCSKSVEKLSQDKREKKKPKEATDRSS